MPKNPERAATWEGKAVAYRTALERLMAAVRGVDPSRGVGWDAVTNALAAADAALVRNE